jgi:hypothetical protein
MSTVYLCGELQWRRPPLLADGARWIGVQTQVQVSPASSSVTGELEGGSTLDDGVVRARGAASPRLGLGVQVTRFFWVE